MDSSKKLTRILGLYIIIIGFALLINMDLFKTLIQNLIDDKPLMFVTGFFTLILGLIMVVIHNIWQWNWRLLTTLIGWIVLLKGLSLILFPSLIDKLTLIFLQNSMFGYLAAGINILLGFILCYCSFKNDYELRIKQF